MLWAAERADRRSSAGRRLERARAARPSRASPSASTCRSPPRSAAPAPSTASTPNYRRRDRPRRQSEAQGADRERRSRAADRRPHVGGGRRKATRCSTIPAPRQTLVHVHADAQEIGRIYHPALGDHRDARPPSAPRSRACSRPTRSPGRGDARRRAPTISPGASRRRRQSRPRAAGRDHARAAPPRSRRDLHQRAPAISRIWVGRFLRFRRFEQQLGPTSRLDGLRPAGGGRRQARASRSASSSASPATAIS